ncbi:type VII secretion target [Saccharopolyspora sp. TS4A08]|uniref:Type VII secretion target n=1 Tax=Saccharopolyspora ipomoeae TaxID=3042027 RepID=A0ABT6PKF1_9PSEU|nr:type VII secretion target [Saccharopolyspora sp. TS4A08]MDI2028475.1 type VII secretion target [Saccharopolyspora sp. TS4A08]
MTDGFRADVPVIKQHSNQVQGFADRVKTAHSAAETTMDTNAFGIFGQFLAAQCIAQAEVTKSVIETGGKSLDQIKTALDETAAEYERTDQENSSIIEGIKIDF